MNDKCCFYATIGLTDHKLHQMKLTKLVRTNESKIYLKYPILRQCFLNGLQSKEVINFANNYYKSLPFTVVSIFHLEDKLFGFTYMVCSILLHIIIK